MGWFRKMFGAETPAPDAPESAPTEEAPARATAPTQAQDDPYRGTAFVEVEPAEEAVVVGKAKPIWHWHGRVLAIEPNRRGPLPLRWLVYTGLTDNDRLVLRKVTFGEGGYRIDWEHRTEFPSAYDYTHRIGDRIVMPRATGMMAIHVATGRLCWELPHPAALQKPARIDRDGNLVVVFTDQSWMVLSLRDGATITEGIARNDRDIEEVSRGTTELGTYRGREAKYGGATIKVSQRELEVRGGGAGGAADEPVAPTKGGYPLDGEWEGGDWTALAGGKLAIELKRSFGGKTWGAVGLLDPTSLEPLQLLELGQVTSDVHCWVVDELLAVDTDLPERPDDVVFVIDPELERIVAMFREDKADGYLFDRDGNRIWEAPL